ncbi:hypothetical protein WR25_01387 [Diploscapter pachys]|uniref:Uncharacterized protein n=1 Tax=Diploscapter pachys TaxID=2018661 RepID=A0A2A2LMJ1_9BILA|nr:hypothetical protein WR25_01387 [Diploscapter pachys]
MNKESSSLAPPPAKKPRKSLANSDSEKQNSPSTVNSSQEEKELRRERGEMLLKLFKSEPTLANTASARKLEQNQERAQMWDKITQEVNDTFGDKLEYLTTEKVKKLLTYYKKKEDGNYENVILYSSHILFDEDEEKKIVDEDLEENGLEIVEVNDEPEKDEISQIQPQKPAAQTLIELLASISEKKSDNIGNPVISTDRQYELKKERHEFVVQLAEHYMERMCFDNSSRSAAVNAERHNMWIRITHKANEKFADALGALGVEQAKKLYSNCKRRRRVKQTTVSSSEGRMASLTSSGITIDGHSTITSPCSLQATSSRDSVSRQLEDQSASPQPEIAGKIRD